MMIDSGEHWERVYTTKQPTEVSWYQQYPKRSLELIHAVALEHNVSIIDVGGGASTLIDELMKEYSDLTVLDISETALSCSKSRLGRNAEKVSWIIADITKWKPTRTWKIWHDRAVFHFMTETTQQSAYIEAMSEATIPGTFCIISSFALDGPDRCSGLPVQRYSPETLAARLGKNFELVRQETEDHKTPWSSTQNFEFSVFKRR